METNLRYNNIYIGVWESMMGDGIDYCSDIGLFGVAVNFHCIMHDIGVGRPQSLACT